MPIKITTYNVNGIRAAIKKGFAEWLVQTAPDVLCLQEIKAEAAQFDIPLFESLGYGVFLFPAEKKGYSGTAILSKKTPLHVEYGMGIPAYDGEGRMIRADFDGFSVMSVYMPSGSSGEERQGFKFEWMRDFSVYIAELRKSIPNLIVCGDYNICHRPIDIHDPVRNKNSSGFLPEEREWLDGFFKSGFTDAFRHLNPSPNMYTWWSYRAGARGKNLGWRIDYIACDDRMTPRLKAAGIENEAMHSDHCPCWIELL